MIGNCSCPSSVGLFPAENVFTGERRSWRIEVWVRQTRWYGAYHHEHTEDWSDVPWHLNLITTFDSQSCNFDPRSYTFDSNFTLNSHSPSKRPESLFLNIPILPLTINNLLPRLVPMRSGLFKRKSGRDFKKKFIWMSDEANTQETGSRTLQRKRRK